MRGGSPFTCHLFVCRGRCGDLLKVLWWDGQGLCLFSKRLEKGRFVWPSPADGKVVVTPAQLAMLVEGIDWRMPLRTWRPELAGYLLPLDSPGPLRRDLRSRQPPVVGSVSSFPWTLPPS